MREQISQQPLKRRASAGQGQPVQQRRSGTTAYSAPPHHVGHYAGLHPEDQPYLSAELTGQEVETEEDEPPDSYYSQKAPLSTRRYRATGDEGVITQGNRQLVIHRSPPPQRKLHFHWLFWTGIFLALLFGGIWTLGNIETWWINQENTWSYGYPRTYQTDAVVFQNDTPEHPTHVMALNLEGKVEIFVLPQGQAKNAKIYYGPDIYAPDPSLVPVTVSFQDVDASGRKALLVHIAGQTIVYTNNGNQFIAPK